MVPLLAISEIGSLVGTVSSVAKDIIASHQKPAPASEQFESVLKSVDQGATEKKATDFIKAHDADGNGTINLKEFGGNQGLFQQLDLNGDGELDKAELTKAFAPKPNAV